MTPAMTPPRDRLPTFYIPHGGGPCFFMEWTMGPADTWNRLKAWLEGFASSLSTRPEALLVISGHWEGEVPTVNTAEAPPLLFDYSGFPPSTYELTWPAPGSPSVAAQVRALLAKEGITSAETANRGLDHGVFVPLKVAFPNAEIPTVQLSLKAGLDPRDHLAIGHALAPLRDEGVLIIGSGMSYHNMRSFMTPAAGTDSAAFDEWLAGAVSEAPAARDRALEDWSRAPRARACHPREEHLIPLMVAAGAGGQDPGRVVFRDVVMGSTVSAIEFRHS
jgi:aromatic ring-opening dioxygenase catalytic subunit (LigB family)